MSSNLRSKPIEGHVTDSAGNVLRNSQIIIKQAAPSGSITMGIVQSDDDGYFQSKPLPNGLYDIYESGISIARIVHTADRSSIQCFRPGVDNYDVSLIRNFTSLTESYTLNSFKWFLQIEPEEIDVSVYGSSFPIYDVNISLLTDENNEYYNIAQYFNLTVDSRITTTRFDIEYFAPLTSLSSFYKRIRWAGIPAIRFGKDSKLIVPLDYFSIVANLPKITSNFIPSLLPPPYESDTIQIAEGSAENIIEVSGTVLDFRNHVDNTIIGDIVKLTVKGNDIGGSPIGPFYHYSIVVEVDRGSPYKIITEKWLSSRFLSNVDLDDIFDAYVEKVESFDGMFQGISDINDEANERFTLVENMNAQDYVPELYNYNNQGELVPAEEPPPAS